jgi:hypothetical protein
MRTRSLLPGADDGFRVVVPEPDESVHAYMHRLAQAYGLPSVKPLLAEVSRGGPRPFSLACASRLAELGGVSVDEVARLDGFDADYGGGVSVWTFGREQTSLFPGVNCRRLPVCSKCLSTRSSIPGFVHLSAMSACPLHGCRLVCVCPNCNTPLRAERPQMDRCGCRCSFRDLVGETASAEERVLACAIYSRITGTAMPGALLRAEAGEFNLAALALDDLVYLHWAMGHILPRPRPCALGTRRRLSPRECSDATTVCILMLQHPREVLPLVRAWLCMFEDRLGAEGTLPFGLFRSVLKRLVRMRGIPMISRLIAEELAQLSSRHPYKPAVGPKASSQMALFEDAL